MGTTQMRRSYGEWLTGELEARGWGARTLARKMESDPQKAEHLRRNLIRYKQGKHVPVASMQYAIAEVLGISRAEYDGLDSARREQQESATDDSEARSMLRDLAYALLKVAA